VSPSHVSLAMRPSPMLFSLPGPPLTRSASLPASGPRRPPGPFPLRPVCSASSEHCVCSLVGSWKIFILKVIYLFNFHAPSEGGDRVNLVQLLRLRT
jgi:hypothetical protein